MKKLAISFLKTADEKLRSIGKHQSATVVQTQKFAYYKSPQVREDTQRQPKPQDPIKQPDTPRCDSASSAAAVVVVKPEEKGSIKDSGAMSGRAISRVLRERNSARGTDELERSEIKRRSRSEGPNRRIRQSMEEKEGGGKKQTFDGGGRYRRELDSPDSDDSDDSLRPAAFVSVESDSESDREKWTKNPLIVKKVKKSDKRDAEKRFSGADRGPSFKANDSLYHDPNGSGGSNSGSRDSGRGSSKYQRLEEMRKKRLNLSVTSDEESTPASRISRLRQRAIQSGLGEQTPSSLHPMRPVDASQYDNVKILRQPNQNNSVSIGSRYAADQSKPTPPARPQHTSGIIPLTPPASHESKSFFPSSVAQNTKSLAPSHSFNNQRQPSAFQQPTMAAAQRQSFVQPSPVQKQAPARPPPPNVSAARQSLYSGQESVPAPRALYNSSPEVTVRKFTTQVRIPSADSIHDSITPVNSRVPNGSSAYSQSSGHSQTPPKSQFNEVVELRLKNFRTDKMRVQQKPSAAESTKADKFGFSEDSLDELIESNIQYLDSEIDKEKSKRNSQVNVSRSSSLPDPRRTTVNVPSGSRVQEPRAFQVQASTSIQFHVSLPQDSRHDRMSGPPLIKIAPSNTIDYQAGDSQYRSQPDVVPRKHSYDSHARNSRPSSEYYDRDDLSKSDSQLNAQLVMPTYMSNSLHPNQAYARACVSDMNLRSDAVSALQVPRYDKGMFSDVEYDIEVSERVKKWETFMKVQDQAPNDKKNVNLSTIQENNECEALMLPSEIRKSVLLNKQGEFGVYTKEAKPSLIAKPRTFSSDTSINKSIDVPKLFSVETNAHRFFQVIQDPQTGPKISAQSQNISSFLRAPITINADKSFMSAKELQQYMLANRQSALPVSTGPMVATSQAVIHYAPGYDPSSSQDESTPMTKRSPVLSATRDSTKRASRYQDELEEISNVKSDSVMNLRRRFDNDSATVTSEDDQKSVSTASSRLGRPAKISPSQSGNESVDWTKMIAGYQSKIKDSDVWSPNLESTQGVPVSIERVTARTLQTIPFSEDPFWKEIEELTTFDPSSMAGHLSSGNTQERGYAHEKVKTQYEVELTPPHSSTLPNQPSRTHLMSSKDRMHRSKSLYTPNIAPLTINVDKMSSTISALDDVLDDISRSSIERKQMSPKKRAFETETSILKSQHTINEQPSFKVVSNQQSFIKTSTDPAMTSSKAYEFSSLSQIKAESASLVQKQPLQFYQQQRQQTQQNSTAAAQVNRQSQIMQGNTNVNNNYQLDPDLLKQKLLNTGLVVETDTEESVPAPMYTVTSSVTGGLRGYPGNNHLQDKGKSLTTSAYVSKPLESESQHVFQPYTSKGSSALDEIQKALEPFSTSYQPGPESLYGTAILESFKGSGFDTTRGPQTKSTGWLYQLPSKETSFSAEASSNKTPSDTLQKVNDSMDDLKDLAQTVERRINIIKAKLQSADEKSLDNILNSLKKVTPEQGTDQEELSSFEDYYLSKKAKLSEALTELDRIYKNLEISNEEIVSVTERGKYKQYRPSKSNDFILAPKPKSEHLKPMQTRISSFYIPGLENKTKQIDKETESEFDILSKSFQAIVDEVNQTSDLLAKSTSDNTAPETQKQTFKITLKPGDASQSSGPMKPAPSNPSFEPISSKLPEPKIKYGRFRSKLQDAEADPSVKTTRSKSVPEIPPGASDMTDSVVGPDVVSGIGSIKPSISGGSLSSSASTNESSIPVKQTRSRVRPVKDNKIIQDDRATRRGSNEKILPSPQPSPKITRKIIYNNGIDLDLKPVAAQSFQDSAVDGAIITIPLDQMPKVKLPEDKNKCQDIEINSSVALTVLSPSTQKKIPPPTAAKPVNRSESMIPTLIKSPVLVHAKQEPQKLHLKLNTAKPATGDSGSSSSNVTVTSSAASTASISLTPPVFDGAHSKLSQSQTADENNQGGGQRSKRRIGTGVALLLDRFCTSEVTGDKLKKRLGTRSAPDLCSSEDGTEKQKEEVESKECAKPEDSKSVLQIKLSSSKIPERPTLNLNDKKSINVTSLERKITDPEGKGQSSGTSSPSSPSNKPPQHPWKRLLSDPEKSVDTTTECGSPKVVTRVKKIINVSPSGSDTATPRGGNLSPVTVTRRVRPTDRKIQTESTNSRPHSFHELISHFEKNQSGQQKSDKLRKCASADALYSEVLVDKMFRSEPDLTSGNSDHESRKENVVFKFEMKVVS